jgi:hypothetical protein
MSVDHLVNFLNKFWLDDTIRKTWKYFNKLGDSFPIVSKESEVLIDKESDKYDFIS